MTKNTPTVKPLCPHCLPVNLQREPCCRSETVYIYSTYCRLSGIVCGLAVMCFEAATNKDMFITPCHTHGLCIKTNNCIVKLFQPCLLICKKKPIVLKSFFLYVCTRCCQRGLAFFFFFQMATGPYLSLSNGSTLSM